MQLGAGGKGKVALVYYATSNGPDEPWDGGDYAETTWDVYLSVSLDADAADPTFATVQLNEPGDPLVRGACNPVRCQNVYDFIDIRIGPDGAPWAPIVDTCVAACRDDASTSNNAGDALAGRLWNLPSL